jgi:2-iminobutanoate/2-iminopropanoate deaminase
MEEFKMNKESINAKNAPAAVGPYVHAVKAGDMVFTSGQLGLDPVTGNLPEGVEAQAHQSLKNLRAVLMAAGLSYSDVVKTTVFLDNMNDFAAINTIYAEYFTGEAPARSCVEVAKLPKGALIEIEAIAVKSK